MSEESVLITWKDVSVYILDFHQKVCKQVIHNVRGVLKPGELTGILGGSGSGKSSLMTALACRNSSTVTVQGDIRVNGCLVDSSFIRKNSGYMYQEDIFIETMTVFEHLFFMARMKLDRKIKKNEIESRIFSILSDVNLMASCNVMIGKIDDEKVLSGGEKKRLAFAAELLSDPSIIFLDEPTTGQDAYTASVLIDQLQIFASRNKTVLCTIHQPSSAVFSSFQKIILVAEGRIAFAGTNQEAVKFFSSLGYVCPHLYNPADFLVETLGSAQTEDKKTTARRICDAYLSSDASKEIDLLLQLEIYNEKSKTETWKLKKKTDVKTAQYWKKLYWLVHRGFLQVVRDPSIQILRIFQKVSIALIAGLCFFGAIELNQLGIQAVQGVVFILVSENTFFPMYSTLSLIPQELPIFIREYNAGMYPVHLYYVARIIALFPGLIVEPAIFTTIVYWLAGLSSSLSTFFMSMAIIILTMNVSTACGLFFSAVFENVSIAMSYLVPFDYLLMITMGSFAKLSTLPSSVQWIKFISWLHHSTEALSIVQWQGVDNIQCETGSTDFPCLKNGQQVLQRYDFSDENFNLDLSLMVALYISFHLLGYIFLLKKCRKKNFF